MDKIQLGLSQDGQGNQQSGSQQASPRPAAEKTPIAGYFAVGCGLLGIFGPGIPFMPLGLLFSIVALFRGQAAWAFAGLLLAVGGFMWSPTLWGLTGLGAAYMFFDWHDMMEPVYRMIGGTTV